MNKYLIITLLTLSLFSCNKDVSVDGVNINTSSGLNVSTEEWSVWINENGVQIMTNEGTATVWEDWMNVQTSEWNASVWSDGIQTQVDGVGNMNINEKGIQGNVEAAGEISVTNDGVKAGKVNISSGNIAEEVVSDAINQEMNNMDMDMNMNGLDSMMNDALQTTTWE